MHLNTETGIFIEDVAFANELESHIRLLQDPGNAWIAQRRNIPFKKFNRKVEWLSQHLPLDLWPIASTVTVEQATSPNNEVEVIGVLPVKDRWSKKRVMFRLNKAIGLITRPIT